MMLSRIDNLGDYLQGGFDLTFDLIQVNGSRGRQTPVRIRAHRFNLWNLWQT